MGALTLGLVVPVATSSDAASDGSPSGCAQNAQGTCLDAQLRTVADIQEAARTLGIEVELVALPDSDPQTAAELMRRRLAHVDRVMIVGQGAIIGHGKLHAIARSCGLPVLGPDGLAIALSDDKLLSRRALANHNIPVPRSVALPTNEDLDEHGSQAVSRLGWPCVIKPRRGALGQGVQRLAGPEQVAQTLSSPPTDAQGEQLIEREITGRELSVVILDGRVLGIAELERRFTATGVKTTQMICPPDLDAISLNGIEHMALRSCAALGLGLGAGPTRVDIIMSERHNEFVLEVEALPPLRRDGVVARVARAAGVSYLELIAKLLSTAPRTRLRTPAASVATALHA